MARQKAFNVTTKPTGKAPKLPTREGEQRSAVRHYQLRAKSNAEAREVIQAREDLIAEQDGGKPWKVSTVTAA